MLLKSFPRSLVEAPLNLSIHIYCDLHFLRQGIQPFETGNRGIFALTFFYEGSEAEIFMRRSRNPEEAAVKISDQGAKYFWRYDLWNSGFLQSPEIHLKEVTLVKSS